MQNVIQRKGAPRESANRQVGIRNRSRSQHQRVKRHCTYRRRDNGPAQRGDVSEGEGENVTEHQCGDEMTVHEWCWRGDNARQLLPALHYMCAEEVIWRE